jgi:hypothetical protein
MSWKSLTEILVLKIKYDLIDEKRSSIAVLCKVIRVK